MFTVIAKWTRGGAVTGHILDIPEHSMCEDLLDAHMGNLAVVEIPK